MTNNQLSPCGNPLCDGEHCVSATSKVRIIRIDDSENAHLCRVCHAVYVEEGLEDIPFSIFPMLIPNLYLPLPQEKAPITRPAQSESL